MAGSKTPRNLRNKPVVAQPSSTNKPKRPALWTAIDLDRMNETIKHLFHFSSRLINSNASPVGIRVAAKVDAALPLVGVTTLPPGSIPLDYVRGALDSRRAKQIAGVQGGPGAPVYKSIPEHDEAHIRLEISKLESEAEFGTDSIDARLPQILWPANPEDPHGDEYIALTPLPSSGLTSVVHRRARLRVKAARKVEAARKKEAGSTVSIRSFDEIFLAYGGENSHNVGRLAREKQLIFAGPRLAPKTRSTWRKHFKGIRWLVAYVEIDRLKQFRIRRGQSPSSRSDFRTRDEERKLIARIAVATLQFASTSEAELLELGLDRGNLVDQSVDMTSRMLVDSSLRSSDWPSRFAFSLSFALSKVKFRQGETLGLKERDAFILSSIAEDMAR